MTGFWSGRQVLVTGQTGFKGAWLCLWLDQLGAKVTGLGLKPTGTGGAFAALELRPRIDSRIVDVRDAAAVAAVVAEARWDAVFHLAAQALVQRGWADPRLTYETNVLGTSNLLEALTACHQPAPAVVVVTSDKVYANDNSGRPFAEDAPLGGNDPYGASKAAAELVVSAWHHGNPGVRIATARAGNVLGGGDIAANRLIPDAWRAVQQGRPMQLRQPRATRPWQFVLDPLAGYLALAQLLSTTTTAVPLAFNFAPERESTWTAAAVADRVFALWGTGGWILDESAHGPERETLTLDSQRARTVLGWRPRLTIDQAIEWTVEWWRRSNDPIGLRSLAIEQLRAYEGFGT